MKNKLKLFGAYLPIFITLTLAGVIIRTLALILHYDDHTKYFSPSVLSSVGNYVMIAAVLIFFSFIFRSDKNLRLIPDFTAPASLLPTGITVVSVGFVAAGFISLAAEKFKIISDLRNIGTRPALEAIPSHRMTAILLLIVAATAILSAIHFALTVLIEASASTKRAAFGLCTVLFLSLYSIYLYFNDELPLNSTNKILDQMSYLFAAVFFLYETRLSMGREKWRAYIAFGFISASLAAYSAIPSVIYFLTDGVTVSASIYETVLSLSLFVFVTSKLLLTAELIEDKESEAIARLAAAAAARDEEINPIPEATAVIDVEGEALTDPDTDLTDIGDNNQITIDDVVADGIAAEAAPTEKADIAPTGTEDHESAPAEDTCNAAADDATDAAEETK